MLFRLLFNLGENALKFMPPGGAVEMLLNRHDRSAPQVSPEVVLQVQDTGPGIAPEDQPHIFDRFYRGDPARSRVGTGLGLALARSIVLLHGGQMSVDS